ncbi:MAG: hypothetical protein ACYTF0_07080, partial [Planctomycetota bacterium]
MTQLLSVTDLEAHLPHRGVNLFPDSVEILKENLALARVVVPADDPRGRALLGRDGGAFWYEPFLAEYLALTGIPLISEALAADGKEAVYSAISRVVFHGLARMDRELTAEAEITRNRSGFVQYRGVLRQGDAVIMEGEFMSGAAVLADVARQAPQPAAAYPGEALVADFSWKDASQRYIDSVCAWDADAGTLTACYTYPSDHPFVPGHFPDGALMMGVTQWAAIADAAWEAASRLGVDRLTVDGVLKRPGGGDVVAVRGLELAVIDGKPQIQATKRIAFREPVRPTDGL